jgi:hypothetical protein
MELVPTRSVFWAVVILSVTALVLGYLGMTRFHVVASKTVNGQLQWRFDSRWFFIVTLLFGTFTLAYTLWKTEDTSACGLTNRCSQRREAV